MAFFEEVWAKSVDCGFTRGRGICPSSVGKEGRASSGDYPVCEREWAGQTLAAPPNGLLPIGRDAMSPFFFGAVKVG